MCALCYLMKNPWFDAVALPETPTTPSRCNRKILKDKCDKEPEEGRACERHQKPAPNPSDIEEVDGKAVHRAPGVLLASRTMCGSSGKMIFVMASSTAAREPGITRMTTPPISPPTARLSMHAGPISA